MRDLRTEEASSCGGFELKRLFAGEITGPGAAALRAHVETCDRCSAAWAALDGEKAGLVEVLPYEAFAEGVKRRLPRTRAEAVTRGAHRPSRFLTRFVPIAAAASLAVVAAATLVRTPATIDPDGPHNGIKGGSVADGSAVELIVGGASAPRTAIDGEQLGIGDRVRIRVKPEAEQRWGLAISVDGAGAVTPLYDDGGRSLALEPGHPQELPDSVVFDGPGAERVYVFLSQDRLTTEEVAESARSEFTRAGSVERMGRLAVRADEQDTRLLRKP